jgi:NADPH-dependent 2,4-dienoyl-CoA reductase/sulfur reductase-like enzyme/rhodanese-related sulfurtransferase
LRSEPKRFFWLLPKIGKERIDVKLIIIGGVAAGASAAAKARRCNEDAQIIVFERGQDISYATCGLPYYLSGVIAKRDELLITTDEFFRRRFNVEVRTRHDVWRIDRQARKVHYTDLATGETGDESYDKLIIAVGASAVIPPVPGADAPFVSALKTLEDTDRIYDHAQREAPEHVVVVGGGLVGMEATENFAEKGAKVSVVELTPHALTFLDPEMAMVVQQHLREKGVDLFLSEGVSRIEQTGASGVVKTDRDRELPADLVIMAVGIRPNVELAEKAGLALGPSGGIATDEFMRTEDPDIYAAGDCVESLNVVTGKPALVPMGSAANKQGRAAGANAMGRHIPIKGFTGTVIVKVFDLAVGKTGITEKEAVGEGFSPLVTYILSGNHAGYYPGSETVRIKTVSDRMTKRLLGAQVIGKKGVDKRLDVMATAIYNRMSVDELVHLDLAYAPPYSAARDPVIYVGAVGQDYHEGEWEPITPAELHHKMERRDDFALLDTRTTEELKETGIIPGAVHIPIDGLRERIDELDKEKETILYCAVGVRSYLGNRILAMKGFKNVKTLTGGIESWTYDVHRMT